MGTYLSICADNCIDWGKYFIDWYNGKGFTRRGGDLPIWTRVESIRNTNPFELVPITLSNGIDQSSLVKSNHKRTYNYNAINSNNDKNYENEFTKQYSILECFDNKYYLCQRKCDKKEFMCKIICNSHGNTILCDNNNDDSDSIIDNNTEIKILKLLNHPNILKLEDIYECKEDIYMVFESFKGGELFQYIIEKGSITEEDASTIIRKIASTISYLHSLNIIHRNIQAESFSLASKSDNWDIKLSDFSFAKEMDDQVARSFIGTKGYFSPEMLQRSDYDKKIDIWSLGIISYLIICGCFPFDDDYAATIPNKTTARKNFQLRFPFWANNVSASAKDLLHNLLEVDPECRYSADQVLQHPWIRGRSAFKNRTLSSAHYLSLSSAQNHDVFRKPLHPFLSESKKALQIAKIQSNKKNRSFHD